MLAIKNNLMAESAARHLGQSYDNLSTSVERLSSGLRINSAKDDAAGLAVRELIRADVAVLKQGSRNARDGISMLQTAEGAMGVVDDILVRMKELAEQAATDSYSDAQKTIMQNEFNELAGEIDRIAKNTAFNEKQLLDSAGSAYDIHIGTTETIQISGKNITADGLGVGGTMEFLSGPAVSDPTDTYMTSAGAGETASIAFTIGADTKTIEFEVDGDMTLNEVADAINSASRGEVDGWNAATVETNGATGQSVLKVSAWKTGNATVAIEADADGDGTNNVEWGSDTLLASGTAISDTEFITQDGGGSIDLVNDATTALDVVGSAIKTKDEARAEFGYLMNRLESAISVIDLQAENLLAAESRISDVDVATEMAEMTRNQVLAQAGVSMLGQANQMPQMAMQLLQ